MKNFICIIALSLSLAASEKPTTFFVSPPRTGTHWTMYCIGTLTGRYVSFWHRFPKDDPLTVEIPPKTFFGAVLINQEKEAILHSHYPYRHLSDHTHKGHKLLMIIRNHKEYLIRRSKENKATSAQVLERLLSPHLINTYMHYFKFYEDWEEDKRLLVYYEDLMSDFRTTITKILDFIGETPGHRLDAFERDIEFHRARILKYYNRVFNRGGGAMSQGKDQEYHSKPIPKESLVAVDQYIQSHYPHYWEAYLKRYATEGLE